MRVIRTLAAAAGLASLAACGGGEEQNAAENFDSNLMVTDNLGMPADNMDMNMDMNMDANMDMNAGTTTNDIDRNAADNAAGNTTY